MPVKIIPISSKYDNSYKGPIKFGLYSDKFANFMFELFAEFDNPCNEPSRKTYNMVVAHNWVSRYISSMFSDYNKFYPFTDDDTGAYSKFNDFVFKSQNGEVCMMRAAHPRTKVRTNKEIVKSIANAINKLACISVNFHTVQNKIKKLIGNNKNYYQSYEMEHRGVNYTVNVYIRSKDYFETVCYVKRSDKSVRRNVDFKKVNVLNPYTHFDLSDNTYKNPNYNIKFLHTSFTTRDAYLIYLLLTGASNKKLAKEGYSQTEIDEMVGKPLNLLEYEIVQAEYKNANNEIDKINKEFEDEAIALKRKLADNFKEINDAYEIGFKKLVDKYQSQYNETVNNIREHMDTISAASSLHLKEFDPVNPVNMSLIKSIFGLL